MSVLDQATKEQFFAFKCDRSVSELALETVQSKEFKEAFNRFIGDVIDVIQYRYLEQGEGECEFVVEWHQYKGLFPFSLPAIDDPNHIADFNIYEWIEKTVLAQANSILRFIKASISLDGMGFVGHSYWRSNTLCFVMDSVLEDKRSQEGVE